MCVVCVLMMVTVTPHISDHQAKIEIQIILQVFFIEKVIWT